MRQTNRPRECSRAKQAITLFVTLTCVLLFGCGPTLKEASSNFDAKDVVSFLQVVSGLVESGFGLTERNQLLETIKSMKVDEKKSIEFSVTFKAQQTPLKVSVHIDDIDAVDLYFYSVPGLAEAIHAELAKRLK